MYSLEFRGGDMASQPRTKFTPNEYLAFERNSDSKNEFLDGEIFAMGGASPNHVLIVTNVVSELRSQLKSRPCTVYSTDLRVRVSPAGLYTYPDVIVVCDKAEFSDEQKDTLINPTLIVEVLSDSTKDYDRGGKFEQYREIDTFKEYILIAQQKPHVEHFIKQLDGRWIMAETKKLADEIELVSIGCELALTEIYDKVEI